MRRKTKILVSCGAVVFLTVGAVVYWRGSVPVWKTAAKPIPPLSERILRSFSDSEIDSESTDSKGNRYALLHSSALGSWDDLFLLSEAQGTRQTPVFTGVYSPHSPLLASKSYATTSAKFLRSDWAKQLVDNTNLTKDSDQDGLSDLVEERFGTNPVSEDTDGDGVNDEFDPWPLTRPSLISDSQMLVRAIFKKLATRGYANPIVVDAERCTPFEIEGAKVPSFWREDISKDGDLEKYLGKGVESIAISSPSVNFWRTEASVEVIDSFGSKASSSEIYLLRKIRGEWLVESTHRNWVSFSPTSAKPRG